LEEGELMQQTLTVKMKFVSATDLYVCEIWKTGDLLPFVFGIGKNMQKAEKQALCRFEKYKKAMVYTKTLTMDV